MSIGQIVVDLLARTGSFNTDIDRAAKNAKKRAEEIDKAFSDAGKKIGAGIGLAAAAGILIAKNAIDSLAQLDDMAQKTGAAVEGLSKIQQTAVAFSQDMGEVDAAITRLARGMATVDDESNKTSKALEAIGLSARDASGNMRDPAELFTDIARKLQGYQDGAQKAALMTDLLGKSGANLLPFMNDLADNVDRFAGVSGEAAAEAARFQDQLGAMRAGVSALAQSILGDALPAMNALLQRMQMIQKTSITGWLFSSGKEEQNAGGRLNEIRGQLDKISKMKSELDPSKSFSNKLNDVVFGDIKDLERQEALLKKQKSYLEGVQQLQALGATGGQDQVDRMMNPAKVSLNYESGKEKKAKSAAKEAADEYKKLIESIKEKIDTSKAELTQDSKLTEGQKLAIKFANDLANGKLKETDSRKSVVDSMLLELTATEKLIAAKEKSQELDKRAAEILQNIAQSSGDREREVSRDASNMGRGDNARELASRMSAVEDAFRQHKERLAEDMGELVGSDAYKAKLLEIDDALRAQLKFEEEAFAQRLAMQQDWSLGATRAIENYRDNASNIADQIDGVFSNAFKGMEDALVNFTMTGKLSFKDLAQSILADIVRMQARATMTNLLGGGGSGGGGWLGTALSVGMSLFGGVSGGSFNGASSVAGSFGGAQTTGIFLPGRANGGSVAINSPYIVGERSAELFVPNTSGKIIPNDALGGNQTVSYSPVINIDSRADRAAVKAEVDRAVKQGNADLVDRMQRAGMV